MIAIKVENLQFAYETGRPVLDGISFEIEQGSFTGLIGESGCGKSTLCHILCGIIPHAIGGELSGQAKVGGVDLRQTNLKDLSQVIGFVMQDPDRQIVSSTVEDELAFGPENLCIAPEEIRKRVQDTLELLGLGNMRLSDPNKLSGGQKQLVAIGSILTLQPEIILLDEPYSHLDQVGREHVSRIIKVLREQGKTIIAVEHDHSLIEDADRWILLEQGKIKKEGIPREVGEYI
ncbi:MAG: ABC transporter ATP-binding protein [Bacillota bacterium]|nr:ABC transporter ATP-binding protein [Bacillota bacterium]